MTQTQQSASSSLPGGVVSAANIRTLMRLIEQTEEDQYSCQETFDLLDEYVELVQGRENAIALMPLVRRHLDHCAECTARYEALLRILEHEANQG